MELKKRNMINYTGTMHPILRQGFFNNHVGRYLNRNLYYALAPFEQNKPNTYPMPQQCIQAANELANTYQAANLGTLLVNFVQNYDPKNILDLRTLLYFASNAINYDTSENYMLPRVPATEKQKIEQIITDEQLNFFYTQTKFALTQQFDFFTAATLLQAPKLITVGGTEYLTELMYTTFEELFKKELPFEETVYGIFALMSCFNSFEEAGVQPPYEKEFFEDSFVEVLDSVNFNPSSNLEDTPIYLMLSYLLETQAKFNSSKKFNNKTKHKIFKKIHSLTNKPFKLIDIDEACSLIGFSRDTAIYLNYLAYQNFNVMADKVMHSKISQSSKYNIQNNLVLLLENEALAPAFVVRDIDAAVNRPTRSNENNIHATISNFFTTIYTGNLSKANLYFFAQRYNIHQFEEFMTDTRWAHLFNSEPSSNDASQATVTQASPNPSTQPQGAVQQTTQPGTVPTQPSSPQPAAQPQGAVQQTTQPGTVPTQPSSPQPAAQPQGAVQQTTQSGTVPTQPSSPQPAAQPQGTTQDNIIRNYITFSVPNGPVSLF